jgi:hypothetical protein
VASSTLARNCVTAANGQCLFDSSHTDTFTLLRAWEFGQRNITLECVLRIYVVLDPPVPSLTSGDLSVLTDIKVRISTNSLEAARVI